MLLKFADKRINEYKDGTFYKANTGEDFEVPDILGQELLKAVHVLETEKIPVFEQVERKVSRSLLPQDFPFRAALEDNEIYTLEQVGALKEDDHATLTGIGKVSINKIIAHYKGLPQVSEVITEPVAVVTENEEQINGNA